MKDHASDDVDFAFEVGEQERHRISFHWGQWRGDVRIQVDGREVVNEHRPFRLSLRPVRTFEFSVGSREVHRVKIEKQKQLFYGGLNKQSCMAFVDGRLVAEY